MKQFLRTVLARLAGLLVGLVLVTLSMGWSQFHPDRISLLVEGLAFSLGTTPRGDFQSHSWIVRNNGPVRLRLRTRFTSGRSGFSLWLGQDYEIPIGESLIVSLTCPTPLVQAMPFAGYADVLTNDPEWPRVRFRIVGITSSSTDP